MVSGLTHMRMDGLGMAWEGHGKGEGSGGATRNWVYDIMTFVQFAVHESDRTRMLRRPLQERFEGNAMLCYSVYLLLDW